MNDHQHLRILEAILFSAAEPLDEETISVRLSEGVDLSALLETLKNHYENRGVNLVQIGKKWALRTASDVAPYLDVETEVPRKLSQAGIETLAIIAYHQPVTRAEIEEIRGKALSKGTLDILLEIGWIRPKGRRRTPGRPVTWGTSDIFLDYFGLEAVTDLPGIEELKASGLIDSRPAINAYSAMSKAARETLGLSDVVQDAEMEEDELEEDDDLLDEDVPLEDIAEEEA